MPIEHEIKIVLNSSCEKAVKNKSVAAWNIKQGYLPSGVRIRQVSVVANGDKSVNKRKHYILCVKQRIKSGHIVEIETLISRSDFKELWKMCEIKLQKIRYLYKNWEIDFFKNKNKKTYFCLAEHEMPKNKLKPNFIPAIISSNMIFEVEIGDKRFGSRSLANAAFAKKIYKKLSKGKK